MNSTLLSPRELDRLQRARPRGSMFHLRASNLPTSPRAGLAMTEYAFLLGILLVLFWALDPGRSHLDLIPVVKHFPVVIVLSALTLAIFGVWINHNKGRLSPYPPMALLADFKYLLLLSVFVISGSLYAKFVRDINETFLTMGVFALAAPMTAWFILNSSAPAKMLKLLAGVYILAALVSAGVQMKNFGSGEVFHQREHLVIPVLGVVVYFTRGIVAKVLGILLIVAIAVSASKITAFITALATVGLLLLTHVTWYMSRQKNALKTVLAVLWAITGAALAVLVVYVLYAKFNSYLPSGNPRYRLHMYELAFDRFLESPLWGVGFSQSAVTYFDLFRVNLDTQNLPTHSDPLDLAANGGVIGLGLWVGQLWSVLWPAWTKGGRTFGLGSNRTMVRSFYLFLLVSLTGVLVSLFNPILNLPNQAWAFWASLGVLAAFSRLDVPSSS